MNSQEKYQEDIIRQYINPEMTEEAPVGFSSKVMERIQSEAIPHKTTGKLRNKYLVPAVSAAVTILLIVAAFLIPGHGADSPALPFVELFRNTKISLPEIDLTSVFSFSLPALLIYIFIGILILSLFDRVLNVLFHRDK